VHFTWANGSKSGVNVWHFRQTSLPVFPLPPIPTAIKTFYDSNKQFAPSDCVYTFDGVVRDVSSVTPTDPPVLQSWSITSTGGATTAPNGVGLVIGWRSSLATRRGRGRTFLSPLSSNCMQTSDGTIADTQLTAIKGSCTTLVNTSVADGNGAIVVWSPTDHIGRDIISFKVNDKPAWLSSRRG